MHFECLSSRNHFFLEYFFLKRGFSGKGIVSIARSESRALKNSRNSDFTFALGISGRGTVSIARSESIAEKSLRMCCRAAFSCFAPDDLFF
jgi:hypothetical protein